MASRFKQVRCGRPPWSILPMCTCESLEISNNYSLLTGCERDPLSDQRSLSDFIILGYGWQCFRDVGRNKSKMFVVSERWQNCLGSRFASSNSRIQLRRFVRLHNVCPLLVIYELLRPTILIFNQISLALCVVDYKRITPSCHLA